jgi:hypothetical protein
MQTNKAFLSWKCESTTGASTKKTLYLMINGILRRLKESEVKMNFLNNEDMRFNKLKVSKFAMSLMRYSMVRFDCDIFVKLRSLLKKV